METSSEVTVRTAGIDQRKALRTEPSQSKCILTAVCILLCHTVPSGGGTARAVGFRGTKEGVGEDERFLSPHSVA